MRGCFLTQGGVWLKFLRTARLRPADSSLSVYLSYTPRDFFSDKWLY